MFLLEEIREKDNGERWNPAFQMINLDTRQLTEDKTIKTAKAPQNRSLNRYRDVLPYDDTRVMLKTGNHDYINANYVEVEDVRRKYILAQGPLQNTCPDFWRMVWENECPGIVMLCRIVEKQMVKCHPYWPMGEDEVVDFGSFQVKNVQTVSESDYIIRDLLLTYVLTGESRTIKQFHFMTWPDFGVPENAASFLGFLDALRSHNVFGSDKPPLVHCSAGIGRSGTIILVDSALKLCEDRKSPDSLNIRDMLLSMRNYRCGLVQTPHQYRFAYIAILTGLYKMFPQLFQDAIEKEDAENEDEEDDNVENEDDVEPPALPVKSKSNVPPQKPPRAHSYTEAEKDAKRFKQLNELSDGSEDDNEDEEVIDLSDPGALDELSEPDQATFNEVAESESEVEVPDDETDNEDADVEESDSESETEADAPLLPNETPPLTTLDENTTENVTSGINNDVNQGVIGAKARENELRHRQRQEKTEATNELINNIKRKMKDSEKQESFESKALWYIGVAIVVTSCVAIAYSWMR